MKKAVKWSGILLALLCILTLLLWWGRHPVTIWLSGFFLSPYQASLTCLDYELGTWRHIKINRLCLQSPQFSVNLRQALWQPFDNQLQIDAVNVQHHLTESDEKTTGPVDWQIPPLPDTRVKSLHIQSPWLRRPLEFELGYSQHHLTLSGPWQANLELNQQSISADLRWSLADLSAYLSLPDALGQDLLNSRIDSRLHFDGGVFNSSHQLALNGPLGLPLPGWDPPCTVALQATGRAALSLSLRDLGGELDLSGLPLVLDLAACPLPWPAMAGYQPQRLSITLPAPVVFNTQEARLGEVQVRTEKPLDMSLDLQDLLVSFTGKLTGQYQLQASYQDWQAQGKGGLLWNEQAWRISADQAKLSLARLQTAQLNLSQLEVPLQFTLDSQSGLNATLNPSLENISAEPGKAQNLSGKLVVTSSDMRQWIGDLQFTAQHITGQSLQLIKLKHQSRLVYQQQKLGLEGSSEIGSASYQAFDLGSVQASHRGNIITAPQITPKLTHQISLGAGIQAQANQETQHVSVSIPDQPVTALQGLASRRLDGLELTDGRWQAELDYQFSDASLSGKARIERLDLSYQNYQFEDLSLAPDFTFSSGRLQLRPTRVTLNKADIGLPLTDIHAQLQSREETLELTDIEGKVLGGTFSLPQLTLNDQPQQMELTMTGLQADKLASLQQQSGIQLQGELNAVLPIHLDKQGMAIKQGRLTNAGPGKLRITDSQAFDSLLASQPNLAPMLSVLKNLNINSLDSRVSLQPDGWLSLDMAIKGRNPDKQQDVNFNYTHEENIFTLLRALRLGEEVQQKVEQSIKENTR
ncbi:intermembrane phospholipid transport YdbH family protein [Bowmanella dokdonensis]|uniref:YdbH domain-containing protein n=1 Tax=Bowmanella dokdonensis TaxID=751969 RepID=A0A939DQJ2_9ALTE|nr:YdbH domain-containing protein [Bowmanella dokdonensis]MBN7826972.1 YdbH domain-containing protein [Bowmanella dokdonensis]